MPKTATARTGSSAAPGVIEPQALYTLAELQARLRVGSCGLRSMRRAGLRVYRVGGRGFVLGRDVIDFIVQNGLNDRATDSRSAEVKGRLNE